MSVRVQKIEEVKQVTGGKPLLLFDGVCNLCAESVQFVIERDPDSRIRFASLQSELGQSILALSNMDGKNLNSVILVDKDKVYIRSSAPLRTTKYLSGAWKLMQVFLIVPPFIRNAVYDWVARNRYKWFGKKEMCWMPTPELKARFLD